MPIWLSYDARHLIKAMLQVDPAKRITISEILNHKWIYSEKVVQNLQIQKENFDEETFWRCHLLFPDVPLNKLRKSIVKDYGYQTATYWILKATPVPKPLMVINYIALSLDFNIIYFRLL